MKVNQENIQNVDCLTVRGEASHTAIVMLHGYGANMRDLFPLWELWHHEGFDWFFPNGLLSLPMGFYEGRAWFSIDIEELELAMREGRKRDLTLKVPLEFDETLKQLTQFISHLRPKYKRLVLGGFSQGAMCSSHLAFNKNLDLSGLILLSGGMIAESKFEKNQISIPFYQSHGSQDPILSIEGAKKLFELLSSSGMKGEFEEFRGVHEIPSKVIDRVKKFLSQFAH